MRLCENEWRLGILGLLIFNTAIADTSIWKISKGNHHLYLGGTVHILAEDDYPLPAAYERVYQLSQRLVFETDLAKLQSPAFQQMVLQRLTYPEGRTLADVLSTRTYSRLKQYSESRGIPMASIEVFKPGLVTTVLLVAELQRLGLSGVGVDAYMHSKALQDGKLSGQLETVEEQLGFMEQMGRGREDELIEYTLIDIENLSSLMRSMKQAWRSGDMKKMEQVGIDPYIDKFPDTINNLLGNRNDKWIPEIEAMLKSREVELILVGALHFAGERGLLAQLKSRGYVVEQF